MRTQPARFHVIHGDTRRALLARFPYGGIPLDGRAASKVIADKHSMGKGWECPEVNNRVGTRE